MWIIIFYSHTYLLTYSKLFCNFDLQFPTCFLFIGSHLQRPVSMLNAMHVMQWLRWKKLVHSRFERLQVEGIWKNILQHGVPKPCSSWNKGAIKLLCEVGFDLNSKTVASWWLSGTSFGNSKFWNDPWNFIGTPSIEVMVKECEITNITTQLQRRQACS